MLKQTRSQYAPIVIVLAIAVLMSGCANEADGEEQGSPVKRFEGESAFPTKRDRTVKIAYSASATGALEIDFSEEIDVRVLMMRGSDPQAVGVYLLSVGPAAPLPAGQGASFRIAFDLAKFKGNGNYTIKAGSPLDLLNQAPTPGSTGTPEPPDPSNVLVQWWPDGNVQAQPKVFDNALEPCPLSVSNDGLRGTLFCSGVTDHQGRRISINMSWG